MKGFLSTLAKLLVTAGIIWYIIHKLGWNDISGTLRHTRLDWIVVTALLFFVSNCIVKLTDPIAIVNHKIEKTLYNIEC